MRLSRFAVDDGPHNCNGLLMHAWDGAQEVTAFVSRRVMDDWVDPRQPYGRRKSLFREQYNALGKRNLPAIERIVTLYSVAGGSPSDFSDAIRSDIARFKALNITID